MGGNLGFLSVITNHPQAHLHSAHASRRRTQRPNLCAYIYIYIPCAGLMNEDRYVQGESNLCRYLSREAGDGDKASGSRRRWRTQILQPYLGKAVPWQSGGGGRFEGRWGDKPVSKRSNLFSGWCQLLLVSPAVSLKQPR